jgi:hypothetical protein
MIIKLFYDNKTTYNYGKKAYIFHFTYFSNIFKYKYTINKFWFYIP